MSIRETGRVSASYTVEAALVFPVAFFVLIFMMNYTFYCHDRAKIQAEMNELINLSANYMAYDINPEKRIIDRLDIIEKNVLWVFIGNRDSRKEKIKEYAWKQLDSNLYITKIKSIDVDSSFTRLTIRGKATMEPIGLGWLSGLLVYPFEISFGQRQSVFPREEKARILQALIELGTNIKGVDELLGKLVKFISNIR